MKKSVLQQIIKQETRSMLREATASQQAYSIHAMVGGGQDRVQSFIDDNNIDAQKLVDYITKEIRVNPAVKFDVADYISGKPGTVGGQKNLRDKFIKQFQIRGGAISEAVNPIKLKDILNERKVPFKGTKTDQLYRER